MSQPSVTKIRLKITYLKFHSNFPGANNLKIVSKMDPRMPDCVPMGCVIMSISCTRLLQINPLAPGKFEWNFICAIFKQILVIDSWGISSEITLIWMPLGFTDDQSALVQVMAWCHQETSHYLSQCWPRSLSPYGQNESIAKGLFHWWFFPSKFKLHGNLFLFPPRWLPWNFACVETWLTWLNLACC